MRFESCAKLMSTSQFGQLKQALVEFVKESVSGEFNKANVSKPHDIQYSYVHVCYSVLTTCLLPFVLIFESVNRILWACVEIAGISNIQHLCY